MALVRGTGLLPRWRTCALSSLTVLALLAGGLALPNAQARPTAPVARIRLGTYDGRHAECPRFASVFGDLEARVDRELARVHAALGLPVSADRPARPRIHVQVRDADLKRFGCDRARCRTVCRGGEEHQQIDLYAEYFISGDSDLDQVLRHELVHALMRARMSRSKYQALPHWVREGLAVYVAGEGRHCLRRTLLAREDVEVLLTGLMRESRSLVMYPYAWLGVEYLRDLGGEENVVDFARGLVAGRTPGELIESLTDKPWSAFRSGLRVYARARIVSEARGLEDIRAARDLYRRREFVAAREALLAFLKTHPDSAFAPTARYYLARSWYRERRYDEAHAAFSTCIESDLGVSGWNDECHLFLGITLYEQERDEDAVVMLEEYLHLHPHSDQHDLGYLALGRALGRLERDDEARAAFAAVAGARKARGAQQVAAARELAALEGPAVDPVVR